MEGWINARESRWERDLRFEKPLPWSSPGRHVTPQLTGGAVHLNIGSQPVESDVPVKTLGYKSSSCLSVCAIVMLLALSWKCSAELIFRSYLYWLQKPTMSLSSASHALLAT